MYKGRSFYSLGTIFYCSVQFYLVCDVTIDALMLFSLHLRQIRRKSDSICFFMLNQIRLGFHSLVFSLMKPVFIPIFSLGLSNSFEGSCDRLTSWLSRKYGLAIIFTLWFRFNNLRFVPFILLLLFVLDSLLVMCDRCWASFMYCVTAFCRVSIKITTSSYPLYAFKASSIIIEILFLQGDLSSFDHF